MVSSERRRRSDVAPAPARLGARSLFLIVLGLAGLIAFQHVHEADQRAAAAFPRSSGTIRLAGLSGPVEILRDDRGVPHIRAESEVEGWFGLGFAHAQDRLAQMLWLRAKALGQTARTEGPGAVGSDRLARLLEIEPASAAAFSALPKASQRVLEAYADGVNARIARVQQGREGPPAALRTPAAAIEDWRPRDGLAIVKLLSWCMGGTLETTLVLDELIQRLDSVPARPFFPNGSSVDFGVAGALPTDLANEERLGPLDRFVPAQPTRQLCQPIGIPTGSAWVVDRAKSESRAPMVLGDWHLAPSVPALFYEAEVEAGAIDVAGATMPGSPIFWAGRNGSIAWAAVPANAPVSDLFIETLRRDRGRYQNGRRWTTLEKQEQRIEVRTARGGVETLRMPMLRTHHGPLIEALYGELEPQASGADLPENETAKGKPPGSERAAPGRGEAEGTDPEKSKALRRAARRPGRALAWTGAREGDGLSSMLRLLRATSSSAVRSALEDHHEPVLAVAFADEQGGGGVQVAGWMAKRPLPTGIVPVQGRLRAFEWKQRVPAEELPAQQLGKQGQPPWLLAADQPWPSRAGLGQLEWLWRPGLRATQIEAGLSQLAESGQGRIGLRAASELFRASGSGRAPQVASALVSLARNGAPLSRESEEVASLLARWDGSMAADSAGAAAYQLVLEGLIEALLEPAFGERLFRHYLAAPHVRPKLAVESLVLRAAQLRRAGGWTDEQRVGEAARRSLRASWIQLNHRLGPTRARWAWGSLHRLAFEPVAGEATAALSPKVRGSAVLGALPFGRKGAARRAQSLASPGSEGTLFVAGHRPGSDFKVDRTSVYRVAMDLGSADHLLSSLAPGQSEHPGHPHFDDGLARHLTARLLLLSTHRLVLEEDGSELLRLEPAP